MLNCILVIVGIIVVAFTVSPSKSEMSFNCTAPASSVEREVCSDATLIDLDRQVVVGSEALIALVPERAELEKKQQREWPEYLNQSCASAATNHRYESFANKEEACAKDSYTKRVEYLVEQIFRHVAVNPERVADILGQLDAVEARAGRALILRILLPQSPESEAEVVRLLNSLPGPAAGSMVQKASYDGSLESIINYLQSSSEATASLTIPCVFIERAPVLITAAVPMYGSNKDNFLPRIGCSPDDHPLPESVSNYLRAASKFDGGFRSQCTGSLRHFHGALAQVTDVNRRLNPRAFLTDWRITSQPSDDAPLTKWSYLGLANYKAFQPIKSLFHKARADLAAHYRDKFELNEVQSLEAAHRAIWADMYEGWWSAVDADPVRKAILEGSAISDVRDAVIHPRQPVNRSEYPYGEVVDYLGRYAGLPDSLLMVAVTRPEVIEFLLQSGEDVNWVNPIGKTALMTAAQYDNLTSARMLLDAGANPKAATRDPKDVPSNSPPDQKSDIYAGCGLYAIAHGRRTALMYAAANASLPVIELLLSQSDVNARDSKGLTALDYLLGQGPVPANPVLSPAEREHARVLLSPVSK